MYEPGKRVARGWNARRTSGESRDTVQRRYKERRSRGEETERKRGEGREKREEEREETSV